MIRIVLSSEHGFCPGDRRAVSLALPESENSPHGVFILHDLVHNESVVRNLKDRGVTIVKSPAGLPPGATLIFSAHGVSREMEQLARSLPLIVKDATCPMVRRVHDIAAVRYGEGRFILLAGKHGHCETEGILGRVPQGRIRLLEKGEDAERFVPEPGRRYVLLSQTTFLVSEFERIAAILKKRIPELLVERTICPPTSERQAAVRRLASECGAVVVVGSPESSNTRRLCESARMAGAEAYLMSENSKIPGELASFSGTLGVISGASASEEEVRTVLAHLLELPGAEFAGESR